MKAILGITLLFLLVSADAALQGRLPLTPGGTDFQAWFDEDLQITWTADADINGMAFWGAQVTWANELDLGGTSKWRLASIQELDHLYTAEGVTSLTPDPFSNVLGQPNYYWSGTTGGDESQAHYMSFTHGNGNVTATKVTNALHAWAVRSGDPFDNCLQRPNDQTDSDGDGIGNACDADLNNDCAVNAIDLGLFKSVFFSADPHADFNSDGVVNALDLGVFRSLFFLPPGPSGLQNICG